MTVNQLSDITQLLDIKDQSIRTTIEDLIEVKIFLNENLFLLIFFLSGEYSTASLFL